MTLPKNKTRFVAKFLILFGASLKSWTFPNFTLNLLQSLEKCVTSLDISILFSSISVFLIFIQDIFYLLIHDEVQCQCHNTIHVCVVDCFSQPATQGQFLWNVNFLWTYNICDNVAGCVGWKEHPFVLRPGIRNPWSGFSCV